MKVKDCMSKDICFVKPNCSVYDAARIMCENHVGCIPVCDDEKNVLGLLTDRDIVIRGVACNKDSKSTNVSDIMTCNVCTCNCDSSLNEIQNAMAKNQVRRVPLVDENNKMVGVISLGDLAQKANEIGMQNVCTTIENICNCKGNVKNGF